MNTCKVCNTGFETWEAEHDCEHCDEFGEEEVWRDWSFGEPDKITCQWCHGSGTLQWQENQFCCEDCREEYFRPNY